MKVKTPSLIRFLLPGLVWEVKTEKKEIFLTFDDGPHPEITPKVLDILDKYKAKATFFCVGENVSKHPQTYAEILKRGHKTANHTYNHLKGWITKNEEYYQNIQKCAAKVDSKLFRPPYGKIGLTQISAIKKDFSIVMWSVLPRDFDRKVTPEECLRNAVSNSKEGSIIVFHDSLKSAENMLFALPKLLDHFSKQGFAFPVLTSNKLI